MKAMNTRKNIYKIIPSSQTELLERWGALSLGGGGSYSSVLFSAMLHSILWWRFIDVSEELIASIFKVEA
jgi:hypothetical protein